MAAVKKSESAPWWALAGIIVAIWLIALGAWTMIGQ
jgi:hypothetical protein